MTSMFDFRLLRSLRHVAAGLTVVLLSASAQAASCGHSAEGFNSWLEAFKHEAVTVGISLPVAESTLKDVSYDSSVVAHDRGQKVFRQSFEQFSGRMINSYRLAKGKSLLKHNEDLFRKIEQMYGVPGAVLVAIWGLETDFGSGSGQFKTLNALATLAYDCRRSEHFHAEFLDALRIVERGDLKPSQMRGAWAGEIGQTQLMPSSYMQYAVDFSGKGKADLLHDSADALASTANYLQGHGWQSGLGWDEDQPNFTVLLEWNKAHVYAMTIALFADRLEGK